MSSRLGKRRKQSLAPELGAFPARRQVAAFAVETWETEPHRHHGDDLQDRRRSLPRSRASCAAARPTDQCTGAPTRAPGRLAPDRRCRGGPRLRLGRPVAARAATESRIEARRGRRGKPECLRPARQAKGRAGPWPVGLSEGRRPINVSVSDSVGCWVAVNSEQRRSAGTHLKASWPGLTRPSTFSARRNGDWRAVRTKKPVSLFAHSAVMLDAL